jgi:hypothetical protein
MRRPFSGIKVARAPHKDEARVGRASLLLSVLGHRGWLTGGVGGTAPMPLGGELGHADLVPVAGQL